MTVPATTSPVFAYTRSSAATVPPVGECSARPAQTRMLMQTQASQASTRVTLS
ncbi:hypothetical protein [Herbaspirillum sp. YR522]|uniref:hypothetical protein n=1 Tax=Herbaspirillum sp. YR522 TaxID=1144342 RepID=UPI00026FA24C|nr:hypothetical protein [Herbaspirillum sp. YR522]EJN08899.1 hypothetical protein PMI40_01032 [Herbaspirillum sp. YR522]